jgi:hypothetical protein
MMDERACREEGSALVIALVFIGAWAIVITAVLTLAETGFKLAAGTADQRNGVYAADGAVDAAILSTRSYLEAGGDPGDCPALRFVETTSQLKVEDVVVGTECADAVYAPSWYPYETWSVQGDGSVEWLDDPSDDPESEDDPPGFFFDTGVDIPIIVDGDVGRFGDVNGNGEFDEGEPVENPQFSSGDMTATAAACHFTGYEEWGRFSDGSVEWLDDPSDDPEGGEDPIAFDTGADIRVLYGTAPFGDADDSGDLSPGDLMETCEPVLTAHIQLASSADDPEVVVTQWRAVR